MKKYDFIIYIGRFQPFHKGHVNITDVASKLSDNIIFLLGSNNKTGTKKNPFNFQERVEIINRTLDSYLNSNFLFRPVDDFDSDDMWVEEIVKQVNIAIETIGYNPLESKIALIGMNKDESTYYLDKFPFWEYVEYEKPKNVISATEIREYIFENKKININDYLYNSSYEYIMEISKKFSI